MNTERYTIEEVIEAIELSEGHRTTAAEHLGCSIATLLRYCRTYPRCQEALENVDSQVVEESRTVLYDAMKSGDVSAAKWLLARKAKGEFSERTETTGKDGGPQEVAVVDKVPVAKTWDEWLGARDDIDNRIKAALADED